VGHDLYWYGSLKWRSASVSLAGVAQLLVMHLYSDNRYYQIMHVVLGQYPRVHAVSLGSKSSCCFTCQNLNQKSSKFIFLKNFNAVANILAEQLLLSRLLILANSFSMLPRPTAVPVQQGKWEKTRLYRHACSPFSMDKARLA
jgi:hypothetical protein